MGDQQQQQSMSKNTNPGGLELPPGFRFHPSDEEIITFYLKPKVLDNRFTSHAIGEVDINRSEPWELPAMAKFGEKEWYFYCLKSCKYPAGLRANRATKAGYWKATGKDKEIFQAISKRVVLVGMKKTLVFYKGRAPTGDKTDWVMHEFRLDGSGRLPHPTTSSCSSVTATMKSSSQEEWVVCKIYKKRSRIKKALTPCFDATTRAGVPDHRSTSFPMSMQIPMGPNNVNLDSSTLRPIVDPSMSSYSTTGITSTISPPPLSFLTGSGNYEFQMDTTHSNNTIALAQSVSLNQQMDTGPIDNGGFMFGLHNWSATLGSQDPMMSTHHTNDNDTSSLVFAGLALVPTIDIGDDLWNF